MTGWYVLIRDWTERAEMPRALGPYPSLEFCRLAAHAMVPSDRRFWTDEERKSAAEADDTRTERRAAILRDKIAAANGVAGWVEVEGSQVYIDENGQETGWSSSGFYVSSGPSWNALTECVFIDTTAKESR